MPTYEYKCDACGHAFELFHSMSASPVRKCPVCKKLKVKRLIGTGAGLIFKGSGFYITDYRDKSYTDKAKADSASGSTKTETAATSTGGEGANGTADTKKPAEASPAAKGDAKPGSSPAPAATPAPAPKAEPKSSSKSASKKGR